MSRACVPECDQPFRASLPHKDLLVCPFAVGYYLPERHRSGRMGLSNLLHHCLFKRVAKDRNTLLAVNPELEVLVLQYRNSN